MSTEYIHYAITGGPIRAAFEEHVAAVKAARAQLAELTAEVGAKPGDAYMNDCVVAFKFDTKPKGWKRAARCDGYEPGAKMALLKERMRKLKIPNGRTFLQVISGQPPGCCLVGHVMSTASTGYEVIQEGLDILTLNQKPPRADQGEDWGEWWKPTEDQFCRRLRLSEYHKLIEDRDERKRNAEAS